MYSLADGHEERNKKARNSERRGKMIFGNNMELSFFNFLFCARVSATRFAIPATTAQ